jgi:membrane protein implicated in regulation of membrane protease activity
MGLTSIWFAFGALIALLVSFLVDSILVQVSMFILTSLVLMYFTKPIVSKYLKVGKTRTNVDSMIGVRGVVTKRIEKPTTGQVKVKGQIWTAYADEDLELSVDIIVESVEGVKMKVKREEK